MLTEQEKFMKEAIRQAKKARALEEVPIGCVIVYEGKIIARGYNRRNTDKNTLSHAELNAIRKASKKLGDWRLEGCTMYVTLEPCQHHSDSSVHGMQQTLEICKEDFHGLCFVNLVDFDALWGHRRNPEGYGHEIEKFDKGLGALMDELREDDLLILTADHGNDPTYTGTDHTREYVPFVAYSKKMKETGAIENQDTFGVIGATIAENFGVEMPEGTIGKSILKDLA